MKKNDVFLITAILIIAAAVFFIVQRNRSHSNPETDWVVVSIGTEEYARYPLHEDATYVLEPHEGEKNVLEIKNGQAKITEANCSDHICVYQKEADANGDMIVCLPHQLIITIEASKASENDGTAK